MKLRKAAFERVLPNPKLKLLEQVREVCRLKHYSLRTEQAYAAWVRRFVVHVKNHSGGWRHPRELGAVEVKEFLTHLAVAEKVSASTQNHALNALVFLYREVVGQSLGELADTVRAVRPKHLPVVLTRDEVRRLFAAMQGTRRLMAQLGLSREGAKGTKAESRLFLRCLAFQNHPPP